MKKAAVPILVAVILLTVAVIAEAQQPKKIPRVGFLLSPSSSADRERVEAFRQGLRQLGYVEGQNVIVEYRDMREARSEYPNEYPKLAAELVRGLKADLIVVGGGTGLARVAKEATKTIPIIMTGGSDPVGAGLVASLARPGGNITGLTAITAELAGKRLELLKETLPRLTRVSVLWNPADQGSDQGFKEIEIAAPTLGLAVQSLQVRSPSNFESAFKAAIAGQARALQVLPSGLVNS